jgi:hypothetical protein
MAESNWKNWIGKKAHIILHKLNSSGENYEYNGTIDSIEDRGNGLIWIDITDKFGLKKGFASGEIKFIEEKE